MPDADTVFAAGLARLLAARYGLPLDSARVQVVGHALCKLLRWLDRWQAGRHAAATISVGQHGAVRVSDGDTWVD